MLSVAAVPSLMLSNHAAREEPIPAFAATEVIV
jgi:hypothetical protein